MGALPVFLQAATLRAAPNAHDQASALNASAFNVGIAGGALLGGVQPRPAGTGRAPGRPLAAVGLAAMAAPATSAARSTLFCAPRPHPVRNTV